MENENSRKHAWILQGDTPGKPKSKVKRQHKTSEPTDHGIKKKLSFSTDGKPKQIDLQSPKHDWSVVELKCLVEYIALYWACLGTNKTWPQFKKSGLLECLC